MTKHAGGRPKMITVGDAAANFLRSKSLKATPHYIETISGFMRMFADKYGERSVSTLTLDDMEEYAAYLQTVELKFTNHPNRPTVKGTLSKSTIDSHHRTLRAFFNWMLERPEYHVKSNLMLKVPRPRIFESDMRIKRVEWQTYMLLIETAKMLAPAAMQARALALLYMLPDTGCRAEGVCGLRWSDVDLALRRAYVVEKFGKGRFVFFLPITRRRLEAWRQLAPKSEFVFCSLRESDKGQPLTPSGLYQIIIGISERAKLPREKQVAPHDLRHMFATYADESGISLPYLQALMGHERSETTARYIHRSGLMLQSIHDDHSPLRRLMSESNTERR
ncbi:MAG: tyrosine-type recombinase/integrase [Anaerolineae bacterium]|nr:tyrosine-type recombinase/integrase [Anaerolineae bacterium]